jgi:hypothetical protein
VYLSVSLKLKALAHDIAKSEKVPVSRTFVHETVLTRYFHSKIKPFGSHWSHMSLHLEARSCSLIVLLSCPLSHVLLVLLLMPSPSCPCLAVILPCPCPCGCALALVHSRGRALLPVPLPSPVSNHLNSHDGRTSTVIDEPHLKYSN